MESFNFGFCSYLNVYFVVSVRQDLKTQMPQVFGQFLISNLLSKRFNMIQLGGEAASVPLRNCPRVL